MSCCFSSLLPAPFSLLPWLLGHQSVGRPCVQLSAFPPSLQAPNGARAPFQSPSRPLPFNFIRPTLATLEFVPRLAGYPIARPGTWPSRTPTHQCHPTTPCTPTSPYRICVCGVCWGKLTATAGSGRPVEPSSPAACWSICPPGGSTHHLDLDPFPTSHPSRPSYPPAKRRESSSPHRPPSPTPPNFACFVEF